jgi:Na+/melibiose symporter-like transporter
MADDNKTEKIQNQGIIHRWLILPKLLYFMLNLLVYSLHAFQTKFYIKDWNFTSYQVGYMMALQCFNFLGSIFWSQLADRTGKHRTITIVNAFIFCALNALMLVHYFDGERFTGKLWVAGLNTLAGIFLSGLFPLVDAQVVGLLSKDSSFSKDIFGRQRLWGSIAHSVATGMSHHLRIFYKQEGGMFIGMNLAAVLFITSVWLGVPGDLKIEKGKHHHGGGEKKKDVEAASPSPASEGQKAQEAAEIVEAAMAPTPAPAPPVHVKESSVEVKNPTFVLLSMPAFLFFLSFILVAGYTRSIMSIYQKYYVADVLKMNDESSVYLDTFRALSEVGTFFFAQQIISLVGVHWALILSQLAGLIRMFVYGMYSYLPSNKIAQASIIYGVELLKGINTGLVVSSAVKIVAEMAPKGCENTAQGLFSGTYAGLSMAVSGILGGLLLHLWPVDSKKPDLEQEATRFEGMFLVSTIVCFILIIAFTIKYAVVDRVIFTGRKASKA